MDSLLSSQNRIASSESKAAAIDQSINSLQDEKMNLMKNLDYLKKTANKQLISRLKQSDSKNAISQLFSIINEGSSDGQVKLHHIEDNKVFLTIYKQIYQGQYLQLEVIYDLAKKKVVRMSDANGTAYVDERNKKYVSQEFENIYSGDIKSNLFMELNDVLQQNQYE